MEPNSDKLYDLIESWLDGDLPLDEAAAISERIKNDEEFRFRVEQHQLARVAISGWVAEDYKTKIKRWQEEVPEQTPPQRRASISKWWIIVVGSLFVIAGLVFILKESKDAPPPKVEQEAPIKPKDENENTPPNEDEKPIKTRPKDIAAEDPKSSKPQKGENLNDEKTPDVFESNKNELIASIDLEIEQRGYEDNLKLRYSVRGNEDENFRLGRDTFIAGEYETAIKYLENITESSSNYTGSLELMAFAYYKNKNFKKAAEYYSLFAPRKFGQNTDWWLLQFYLADYNNNKEGFWKVLNKIIKNSNHKYHDFGIEQKTALERMGIRE